MELNCTSFLSFEDSFDQNATYLTVCNEVTKVWQLSLMITMLTLLAFSCGGIFILHSILNPFKLMIWSSKYFPCFESIWPKDQKKIKGPILHFILNPSKQSFKESDQKLLSKTGYGLIHWTIKCDHYFIMKTILGPNVEERISSDLIKKTILEGSSRMIKVVLKELQKECDFGNLEEALETLTRIKGTKSNFQKSLSRSYRLWNDYHFSFIFKLLNRTLHIQMLTKKRIRNYN